MKEIQIIKRFGQMEMLVQLLDGKVAMITNDTRSLKEKKKEGEKVEDEFFSDNDGYIFALYQVLKEADCRGGFDHLKEGIEDEEDIEKVLLE